MIERVPGFGGRNERAMNGYLSARPFTQGCLLFKVLEHSIESGVKSGQVNVWLSSQALSLTRSAAGDITGVIVARNGDDCPTEVTARHGVILRWVRSKQRNESSSSDFNTGIDQRFF